MVSGCSSFSSEAMQVRTGQGRVTPSRKERGWERSGWQGRAAEEQVRGQLGWLSEMEWKEQRAPHPVTASHPDGV